MSKSPLRQYISVFLCLNRKNSCNNFAVSRKRRIFAVAFITGLTLLSKAKQEEDRRQRNRERRKNR